MLDSLHEPLIPQSLLPGRVVEGENWCKGASLCGVLAANVVRGVSCRSKRDLTLVRYDGFSL